jgi:hypothetical protein
MAHRRRAEGGGAGSCTLPVYTYILYDTMAKKLVIAIGDEVYEGLHKIIGRRRISRFLSDLARPHVTRRDMTKGYRAMAADKKREREAAEWVDNLARDIAREPG